MKSVINKKCLFGAMILVMCCLFTSCVDYVQSISLDENKLVSNYKVTISKLMLSQTGQTGDDLFAEIGNLEKSIPEAATLTKIDNDTDIGFEINYSINKNTKDEKEIEYIPSVDKKTGITKYPFLIGAESSVFTDLLYAEGSQEMQAIMVLFLAGAKCRFNVSKDIQPEISQAYFDGSEGIVELPVYDYGDSWGIEVPLIILATGTEQGLSMEYITVK